ncbi:hypothetical protein N657DRAFT_675489 [Parathielavia appendiculata]|uniref:Integral membrane protein n=1 Tax=Parathielavia appendiculata TaxID=2587402 RepID=A0AAN6TR24_9PEZI|nr:hypothetical protein N657DRAFT_675489 [Parathielavia appendiculata]
MTEKFPSVEGTNQQGAADNDCAYFGPLDSEHAGAEPSAPALETGPPCTPTTEQPPARPHPYAAQDIRPTPIDRSQSAIRLRRLRVPNLPSRLVPVQIIEQESPDGRRRSSSEPNRPQFPPGTAWTALPPLAEASSNRESSLGAVPVPAVAALPPGSHPQEQGHRFGRRRGRTIQGQPLRQAQDKDCYDSRIVDFLDVVDPEVATLSSITNIQNSLFVPSLGRWVNRRPTYDLSQLPPIPGAFPPSREDLPGTEREGLEHSPAPARSPSLSSVLSEPQYAILPNDASLEGWSEEDIKALNDYVRHMLHSRRSKIKQRLKAFGKYARRPLGFLITLYATLITLFGLAWVLFLIGWIYVGDRQLYAITVIDYTLVALFGVVGDGLAPFRAIDTYHMVFVAHYHRKTWKERKKLLLPKLRDHNDLPTGDGDGDGSPNQDLEANKQQQKDQFFPVLSEKEQARLVHHQTKLAKSHTFYKPHETETHHAFPLRLLIAIVLLLDLHSLLQIALGTCTYGHIGGTATTTALLCCSIATNITAGILISIGDRRTRKKDVLERLLKQDLTSEVMKKMRKKKQKEAQKEQATGTRESKDDGNKMGTTSLTAGLHPIRELLSHKSDEGHDEKAQTEAPQKQESEPEGRDLRDVSDPHMRIPGAFP